MNETRTSNDTLFDKDFTKNIKAKLKPKKAYNIDEMENEFKSQINFGDMLDKNNKKSKETPVSDLIRSTTQSIVELNEVNQDNINQRIDALEDRLQINSVNEKMERVEGLLQSLIINQQNLQHSLQNEIKNSIKDRLLEDQTQNKEVTEKDLEEIVRKTLAQNSQGSQEKKVSQKNIIAASILAVALLIAAFMTTPSSKNKITSTEQTKEVSNNVRPKQELTSQRRQPRYVTTKFVNLRSKASSKANVLLIVPPNSIVEKLDFKQGWNKIKYTDHVKSASMTGWIYGENLKTLN